MGIEWFFRGLNLPLILQKRASGFLPFLVLEAQTRRTSSAHFVVHPSAKSEVELAKYSPHFIPGLLLRPS
jgi:hypothetical protein